MLFCSSSSPSAFLMLDILPPHPMPHATTSDPPLNLPSRWQTLKDVSIAQPRPHTHQLLPPKPVFTASSGLVTPPSDMNGVASSSNVYPQHHAAMGGEGTSCELRPKIPTIQPAAYPLSASSTMYGSGCRPSGSMETGSPLQKFSMPSINTDDQTERRSSAGNSDAIAPTLRLPPTVHTPQSSLPQLAAEITCLFWFETGTTLKHIEDAPALYPTAPLPSTSSDVKPTIGFRKWVVTLLSTTQVTKHVVLLALLFIYRLKSHNPTVKGKPGSEYRLLTVALMLGNKFLDDNTYTNKTWAEVSGISVQEVHIMEVEFLSNMRYGLYTSEAAWKEWHIKLGKFGSYIDRAIRILDAAPRLGVLHPTGLNVPAALPSPPASTNASPAFQASYSPARLTRSNTPILLPQIGSTAVSPIGPLPETDLRVAGHKRSHDEDLCEPPAKRQTPSYPLLLPYPASTISELPISQVLPQQRVSLPSLSIPPLSTAPAPQLAPPLPLPGTRAMSLIYPPTAQWNAPSIPTSIPPIQTTSLPPSSSRYETAHQLSPYPLESAASSPLSATFASASTHTPTHSLLSPSYYLAQRSSPYRPVRRVQTLLVPQSTTSFHNPTRPISQDQMQYHPLGRPMNERRIGHLPYVHHEAWPETQNFNQWIELPPPLPQPIFRQ